MKKSAVWLREDFVNFEWVVICSHFCRSEMIRETTSTHFLTVKKKHAHSIYVVVQIYLWLNIFQLSLIFYSKPIEKKNKKIQTTRYMVCIMHSIFSGLLMTKTLCFILIWAKWVCFTVLPSVERWYIKINVVCIPFKFVKLVYFDVIFQKMNAQRK